MGSKKSRVININNISNTPNIINPNIIIKLNENTENTENLTISDDFHNMTYCTKCEILIDENRDNIKHCNICNKCHNPTNTKFCNVCNKCHSRNYYIHCKICNICLDPYDKLSIKHYRLHIK